jgi:hypothetical protein
MIHEAKLIRTAEKVTSYVENYVSLVGVEKKEEVFNLFDTMHQVFPQWVIFRTHGASEIHYASKNVPCFWTCENFMLSNARRRIYSLVHQNGRISMMHVSPFIEFGSPKNILYRAVF